MDTAMLHRVFGLLRFTAFGTAGTKRGWRNEDLRNQSQLRKQPVGEIKL